MLWFNFVKANQARADGIDEMAGQNDVVECFYSKPLRDYAEHYRYIPEEV